MNLSKQTAKHLRDVYFGDNWTGVNLKDTLHDISFQQAVAKIFSFNTIAILVFHINYYVTAQIKVLQGGSLDAHDSLSFNIAELKVEEDWLKMKADFFANAETLAFLIEQLPDEDFGKIFSQEKYGTYYRNINGLIEHTHYHLGQIALIKKLLVNATNN